MPLGIPGKAVRNANAVSQETCRRNFVLIGRGVPGGFVAELPMVPSGR